MNTNNPYAAPQASLTRVESVAMSLDEGLGRKLFHETGTRELTRLANWNIFIEAMSLLWGVFFSFWVLAFAIQWGNNPFQWIWGAALVVSGLRLWGGSRRPWIAWGYDLLLDAGFALAMVWAILRLSQIDLIALLLAGSVALVLLCLAGGSVAAHFAAMPLYGRYPQRQLNAEVRYRKLNGIA